MRQKQRKKKATHRQFEALEDRQLMTVAPTNIDVAPNGASLPNEVPVTISARFADADGVDNLRVADVQVYNGAEDAPRCFVRYDESTDQLRLWNDGSASFQVAGAPGSGGDTSNGVCTLHADNSSITDEDANTWRVDLSISFSHAFEGPDSIWVRAFDYQSQVSPVTILGSVTFEDVVDPPEVETTVAMYFEDRDAAMALNFDSEMFMCGMIHSWNGRNPELSMSRAQNTRDAWPGIIADAEHYEIPLGFNNCSLETVFGDLGPSVEYPELDITHDWHPDSYWATNTWYSDAPPDGGDYMTVGPLLGETIRYDIIYGGDLTEMTLNSDVEFEIGYHNFGHESYRDSDLTTIENTFARGVEYNKRMGIKPSSLAPPWNRNPAPDRYPVMAEHGFYAFTRREQADGIPDEVYEDVWVIPRSGSFDATTDMTGWIDDVIANGTVLAKASHQEDGFHLNRDAFQTSLAYAKSKVDSGELWATTLGEIARYAEAKSDVNLTTQYIDGKTVVDITLENYDAEKFGAPLLTFKSTMPNGSAQAEVMVNYPFDQTLNSSASRIEDDQLIYSVYLNPNGPTRVEIDGVASPVIDGVDVNAPILSIDSPAPTDPVEGSAITIQADPESTDGIYSVNLIYQVNDDAKQSAIMSAEGAVWEFSLAPLSADDVVSYYVTVTDNRGARVRSADKTFTVEDDGVADPSAPAYLYSPYDAPFIDEFVFGESARFNLNWTDDQGLDGYVFSYDNGSGDWVDRPYQKFSPDDAVTWWDNHWEFRRTVTIDNSDGLEELNDQSILITVDTASLIANEKLNEYGGDIRFVDGSGEVLDFWVESGLNTAATRIWVKAPDIAAATSEDIYFYYGNKGRTVPKSDGFDTFTMFDDFGGLGWESYKYDQNPIKGPDHPAGQGAFSSAIRDDDGTWKMYSSFDPDGGHISLSLSDDGLEWTRHGIVLERGSQFSADIAEWDAKGVWAPVVWKEDTTYHMLYPGKGPETDGPIQMGYATSDDGFQWTKYDDDSTTDHPYAESDPVFNDPGFARDNTEGSCFSIVKQDHTYYTMYNTLREERQASIASSDTLTEWTTVYDTPRFVGSNGIGNEWNFHMFCGHAFEFEGEYYLMMTGQDNSRDHGKFGLFVSGSPDFPEDDTEFKGIVMIGEREGWDALDMDTPWMVPLEDNRAHLYYEACGVCHTETGVAIIEDLGYALSQAYAPGNYVDTNRAVTPSLRVMPPVGWEKSLQGYHPRNDQNIEIIIEGARTGRAVALLDQNESISMHIHRDIDPTQDGVISAWMKTDTISETGDYDMYVYGEDNTKLAMVAGLGRGGTFHYWDGQFHDTGVSYSTDTWYQVELHFDVSSNTYDFVVYDTDHAELVREENLGFGRAVEAGGIDRVRLRPSNSYVGTAYVDDVLVRTQSNGVTVNLSDEATAPVLTTAMARATAKLPLQLGQTMQYRFTATDTDGLTTKSPIYELPFGQAPISRTAGLVEAAATAAIQHDDELAEPSAPSNGGNAISRARQHALLALQMGTERQESIVDSLFADSDEDDGVDWSEFLA